MKRNKGGHQHEQQPALSVNNINTIERLEPGLLKIVHCYDGYYLLTTTPMHMPQSETHFVGIFDT